jgi:hypothetical protein
MVCLVALALANAQPLPNENTNNFNTKSLTNVFPFNVRGGADAKQNHMTMTMTIPMIAPMILLHQPMTPVN